MPMNSIIDLLSDQVLPIKDGLYLSDGRSYELALAPHSANGYEVGSSFDVASFISKDDECVSPMDATVVKQIENQREILCCGEGSHGSEGFIALLSPDTSLLWAMYFGESNPFISIEFDGNTAIVRSSSNLKLVINIYHPELTDC